MGDVTLYTGDCAQVMAERIADGSIDLTVTSPPYDNLRMYKGYTFDFEAIAQQLWRVTKPGGVVVWVVADATINGSETGTSFRQALRFMEIGFNLHDTMIYDKNGFRYPFPDRYHQVFEYMFVLTKGKPNTTNLIMDKINTFQRKNHPKQKREADGSVTWRDRCDTRPVGVRFNIWRFTAGGPGNTKDDEAHEHPAIFPEALARDHIASWSNPGDLVLDPMMGSGTTGKLAVLAQRRFIGIDIAAEYVELARQRIERARSQLPLLPLASNTGFHLTAAPVGLWDGEPESGAAAGEP